MFIRTVVIKFRVEIRNCPQVEHISLQEKCPEIVPYRGLTSDEYSERFSSCIFMTHVMIHIPA